eukprot:761805-Hanusia_phi.AAC.2
MKQTDHPLHALTSQRRISARRQRIEPNCTPQSGQSPLQRGITFFERRGIRRQTYLRNQHGRSHTSSDPYYDETKQCVSRFPQILQENFWTPNLIEEQESLYNPRLVVHKLEGGAAMELQHENTTSTRSQSVPYIA